MLIPLISGRRTTVDFLVWTSNSHHADFRQDTDRKDDYVGSGGFRHDRKRQGKDPRQGRYSSGSTETNLCRKATWGWKDPEWLQHSEGIYSTFGPSAQRRSNRAFLENLGSEVQLRQNDMSKVLCSASLEGRQLQEEEVWSLKQLETQKEAQVDTSTSVSERSIKRHLV